MKLFSRKKPDSSEKKKPDSMDTKSVMFFHRSYRIFPSINKFYQVFEFLFLVIFFDLVVYFIFSPATWWTSLLTKYVLSFVMPPHTLEILQKPYLFSSFYDIYLINRLGVYPSVEFSLVTAIVSLLIAVIIPRIKGMPRSVGVWLSFVCAINAVSAIFFLLIPNQFHYNIEIFSDLYMMTQVTMWFVIPLVMAMALAPLPTNLAIKFSIVLVVLLCSLLFGCTRYIVYFYLLSHFSYLFMAIFFFNFGPLLDYIYIVGVYSVFVSLLAKRVSGDTTKWRWLY